MATTGQLIRAPRRTQSEKTKVQEHSVVLIRGGRVYGAKRPKG
jgi:ribosomal protein S12